MPFGCDVAVIYTTKTDVKCWATLSMKHREIGVFWKVCLMDLDDLDDNLIACGQSAKLSVHTVHTQKKHYVID